MEISFMNNTSRQSGGYSLEITTVNTMTKLAKLTSMQDTTKKCNPEDLDNLFPFCSSFNYLWYLCLNSDALPQGNSNSDYNSPFLYN